MFNSIRIIVLTLIMSFICGCSDRMFVDSLYGMSVGKLQNNIIIGQSTKDDIKKVFGKPERIETKYIGGIPNVEWQYGGTYSTAEMFHGYNERHVLYINFNDKDVVQSYNYTKNTAHETIYYKEP